jgi:phosphate uptake regulator
MPTTKPRIIDAELRDTVERLRSIVHRADELVVEALIALKDPSFLPRPDAVGREREVQHLKRQLQENVAYTFAKFPPVANDLRFLVTVMIVVTELAHMVGSARRIRERAPEVGHRSTNLVKLVLVTQRQADACLAAVYRFDSGCEGYAEISAERLEAIVAGRREATGLFQCVLAEPKYSQLPLSPAQFELEGVVADELERISDCAATVAEQLIFYRTGRR